MKTKPFKILTACIMVILPVLFILGCDDDSSHETTGPAGDEFHAYADSDGSSPYSEPFAWHYHFSSNCDFPDCLYPDCNLTHYHHNSSSCVFHSEESHSFNGPFSWHFHEYESWHFHEGNDGEHHHDEHDDDHHHDDGNGDHHF